MSANNEKDKNNRLLQVQQAWYEKVMIPYIEDHTDNCEHNGDGEENCAAKGIDTELSCPFCMGLTDEYIGSNKKKIMIIGQAARKLGSWSRQWKGIESDILFKDVDNNEEHWPAKRMQNWANDYLNVQQKLKKSTKQLKYKSSAFWDFFRDIKKLNDASLCWDDVDKVHFVRSEGNTETEWSLTYKDEVFLSAKYEYDNENNSLLQREIKIAKPDVVIFAVGPTYALTVDVALGISDSEHQNMSEKELSRKSLKVSKLFENYPNKNTCVVQNDDLKIKVNKLLERKDVVVLWTYHPAALRRMDLYSKALEEITDIISKTGII